MQLHNDTTHSILLMADGHPPIIVAPTSRLPGLVEGSPALPVEKTEVELQPYERELTYFVPRGLRITG